MISELRHDLRAFAQAVIDSLGGDPALPDSLLHRAVARFSDIPPGRGYLSLVEVVDWPRSLRSRWQSVEALPEFGKVIESLQSDPHAAKHLEQMVGTGFWQRRLTVTEVLQSFLGTLLEKTGGLEFTNDAFTATLDVVERYFVSNTLEFRMLAALESFRCSAETVVISPELRIVTLSEADRESLCPDPILSGIGGVGLETHGLEFRWHTPKRVAGDVDPSDTTVDESRERGTRLMTAAISALRLMKPGAVSISNYVLEPATWDPVPAALNGRFGSGNSSAGIPYMFGASDGVALQGIHARLFHLDGTKYPRLRTASRWFNAGYEREFVEDRIVTSTIALEALLGPGHQSIAYRFALRGALLLAEDPAIRMRVQEHLRALYAARSGLVHGDTIDKTLKKLSRTSSPGVFLTDTEELVRQAIVRFLSLMEHMSSEDELLDRLDAIVLTGPSELPKT